jgi:hypothetical protein
MSQLLNKEIEMSEHKYAEVLRAIAEGKPVQYKWDFDSDWCDFDPINHKFHMGGGRLTWRVKPKEKVRKWRWVAKNVKADVDLVVTASHYKDEAEFYKTEYYKNYILVAPVSSTMIEVDE